MGRTLSVPLRVAGEMLICEKTSPYPADQYAIVKRLSTLPAAQILECRTCLSEGVLRTHRLSR